MTVPEPAPVPETDIELMPVPDLAPFDAASPLGLPTLRIEPPAPTPAERVEPPPPRPAARRAAPPPASAPSRPGDAGAAPQTAGAATARMASFEAAVREAIAAAQVYPAVARDRGITGSARLHVVIARDGRLINARLLRSRARRPSTAPASTRRMRARLPAAPADLAGPRFDFEVGLTFGSTAADPSPRAARSRLSSGQPAT